VHRGYSWPGLEKVSQYIHQDDKDSDAEDEELRKVQDCKVRKKEMPCRESLFGQLLILLPAATGELRDWK
jgi:hypothetical protein